MLDEFEFIIAGGGTAGCVLANRLSSDPAQRVLLLEAGCANGPPLMRMPAAFPQLRNKPQVNWRYQTEPEVHANGRVLPRRQGRIIGGSSAINGMLYHRGHSADYEEWRGMGLEGWGYSDVLPYFIRAETSWRGAGRYHGDSGPIAVVRAADSVLQHALRRAFDKLGLPQTADLHGERQIGLSAAEFMIGAGRRADTGSCYLQPALHRRNLRVVPQSTVHRVLLEKDTAVGVEFEHAGNITRSWASREVVVCCGAYNSPQVLMLSGIGDPKDLARVGIAPLHELCAVGRNLQVHANVETRFAAKQPVGFHDELRLDRVAMSILRWQFFRSGSFSSLPIASMAMLHTEHPGIRPTMLAGYAGCNMDDKAWVPWLRPGRGHTVTVINALLHPRSRGRVSLRSSNPNDTPRIVLNLLSAPEDRRALMRVIDIQRAVFNETPLGGMIASEISPGSSVQTPAALDAYLRSYAGASQHPSSTCAMGTDADAVVDAELRVRGLRALRVVDASVMPLIVGAGTCAPTIMIAEKASDMLLGKSLQMQAIV